MILSQRQLEEIAASTTKDFNRFFFGDEADKPDRSALPTPIDQFAKNYLGLHVSFARLSPDGSICGVTAYADTEYKITELGITRTLALKRNQVILDESFILSGNVQRLCAKRRFTLAHECAHQILFQLESEEVKASCEMRYSARTAYTPRELKTREDWNEWQANVLGAAILLPQKEVDLAMRRFAETPLINYEGRYSYGDHLTLRLFCRLFGVSKTTASIRLRQLGYMASMQTLDNLLMNHLITPKQHIERLPNGYITKKQELLDDFEAAAMVGAPAGNPGTGMSVQTTSEDMPVNGGGGNGALQRALNREGA